MMTLQEMEAEYIEARDTISVDAAPNSDYYNMLDEPVRKGSVLLRLNGWKSMKMTWIEGLIYKFKKIYVLNKTKEAYAQNNSIYVHPKTNEYYHALATAEYIITDHPFEAYYVKRAGQKVISEKEIEFKKDAFNAQRNRHDSICDYKMRFTGRKFRIKVLLEALGIRSIERNLKPYVKDKQLILFMTSTKYLYFVVNFLNLAAVRLCTKDTNVGLFIIDGPFLEKNKAMINKLDGKIKIYTKKGALLCDRDTASRRKYVEMVFPERYDMDVFNSFLPAKLFDTEVRRLFGNTQISEIYNFGYMSPYAQMLLSRMKGKKTFVPASYYADSKDDHYLNKMAMMDIYDEVMFFNSHDYEKIGAPCPDLADKYCYIDFMGAKKIPAYKNQKTVRLSDGSEYLILKKNKAARTAAIQLQIVPMTLHSKGDYLVVDNSLDSNAWIRLIKNLESQDMSPIVFDLYNILSGDVVNNYISRDFSLFYPTVRHMKRCYTYMDGSANVRADARRMGHELVYVDADGNICEAPEADLAAAANSQTQGGANSFVMPLPAAHD